MNSLKLRGIRADEFEDYCALFSDYDVVKMTSSWPYPMDEDLCRKRFESVEVRSGQVSGIANENQLIGVIGHKNGELGYVLGKPFWGNGIGTWAVAQKTRYVFEQVGHDMVKAQVWIDNPASAAVLLKNGFDQIGGSRSFCVARNCEMDGISFQLTRDKWEAMQSP